HHWQSRPPCRRAQAARPDDRPPAGRMEVGRIVRIADAAPANLDKNRLGHSHCTPALSKEGASMRKLLGCVVGIALVAATAVPAFAHHPFAAEYDSKKPVTLTGTISKVEWKDPHTHAMLDVKDANGKMTSWDVELGSPRALTRHGWKKDTLKDG